MRDRRNGKVSEFMTKIDIFSGFLEKFQALNAIPCTNFEIASEGFAPEEIESIIFSIPKIPQVTANFSDVNSSSSGLTL